MAYKTSFESYWLAHGELVAREISRTHFSQLGWTIEDNPNKLGVDQHMYRVGEKKMSGHLELEFFTRFWNGIYESFKFKAVTIPLRKYRLFRRDIECFWMCFSVDFTHYILLRGDLIRQCELVSNSVRNNEEEELFYKYDREPIEDLVRAFSPRVIAANQEQIAAALTKAEKAGLI